MTNSETKRCHFVPQTYLEKFYQEVNNRKVLVARPKLGGKTFNPSITNICLRKYLYILPGETEEDRQIIEKFYSRNIESNYNKVYDLLNKSKIKRISDYERELIITTAITMLFRNPFILDRFNEFWSTTIDKLFTNAESISSRSFQIDNKTINIDNTTKSEFLKTNKNDNKLIFNITHLKMALRLIELRINDCVTVTEIEDDHEYISSDNPVSISNPKAKITGIFDPSNFLRLPINTKKCLVIYPYSPDVDPKDLYRRRVKSSEALLDIIYVNKLQHFYANNLLIGSYKSFRILNDLLAKTDNEVLSLSLEVNKKMQKDFYEKLNKRFNL